jgi:drug/metabolite transporter (DMT)-like permease
MTAVPRSLDARGVASALVMVCLFSGMTVARKLVLPVLSPLGSLGVTLLAGSAVLSVLAAFAGLSLRPRGGLGVLVLNGVWYAAFTGCFQVGLAQAGAGWSNSLQMAFPVFTLATSAYVLREEKPGPGRLLGMTVAMGGLLLLGRARAHGAPPSANALILVSPVLLGTQICLVRRLAARFGALPTIAWQQGVAGALCLAGAAGTGVWASPAGASAMTPASWAALAYMAFAAHAAAFWLQARLLARYAASDVSAFFLASPFLGLLAARVALGERLDPALLVSACVMAVGIGLVFQGDRLLGRLKPAPSA